MEFDAVKLQTIKSGSKYEENNLDLVFNLDFSVIFKKTFLCNLSFIQNEFVLS